MAYFDSDGGVHVRMVPWATESRESYVTWAWHPDEDEIASSPYGRANADILPGNGSIVYTIYDPERETIDVNTMDPPHNTVEAEYIAADGTVKKQVIFTSGDYVHIDARWAQNGDLALFRVGNPTLDLQWAMVDVTEDEDNFTLLSPDYDDVSGVEAGFLALTDETDESGAELFFSTDGETETLIYTIPPNNGDTRFLWSLPAGYTFALDDDTLDALNEAGS